MLLMYVCYSKVVVVMVMTPVLLVLQVLLQRKWQKVQNHFYSRATTCNMQVADICHLT